jgi:hypothetical protein
MVLLQHFGRVLPVTQRCRTSLGLPEESTSGRWLSSIFLSLGMNTVPQDLLVSIFDKEMSYAAIRMDRKELDAGGTVTT